MSALPRACEGRSFYCLCVFTQARSQAAMSWTRCEGQNVGQSNPTCPPTFLRPDRDAAVRRVEPIQLVRGVGRNVGHGRPFLPFSTL